MAITTSDIKIKLSIKTGSAGNSLAQGTIGNSLGKYISTTEISGTVLNNLFDDVTGNENAASTVDYRCIFIHNSHASITLQNAKVWISDQVVGGTSVQIALDNIAVSNIGASSAQAAEIANETTAPSGVGTFSLAADEASALSIGSIGPGQCKALWVKRIAANTVAINNDGFTLSWKGDTTE